MNGYAVFDIETTGFRLHEDSIVEIAVVHVDLDGEITGMWDTLLRPRGGEVGPTRVHGIEAAMVQGAPSFASLARRLYSLFAGRVSDQVAQRIADARRELASKVIRQYCIAKGVAVALNPIPVADLLAAAALDAALVMHLGRVYGLPLTRSEAGALIAVISAQLAALMGAIWGVHLVASALKGVSAGLSTVVTAGANAPSSR